MVAMLEGIEAMMKMEIVMAMKKEEEEDKLVLDMDRNNSFVEGEVEAEKIIAG